jgi:hypothetical protein
MKLFIFALVVVQFFIHCLVSQFNFDILFEIVLHGLGALVVAEISIVYGMVK